MARPCMLLTQLCYCCQSVLFSFCYHDCEVGRSDLTKDSLSSQTNSLARRKLGAGHREKRVRPVPNFRRARELIQLDRLNEGLLLRPRTACFWEQKRGIWFEILSSDDVLSSSEIDAEGQTAIYCVVDQLYYRTVPGTEAVVAVNGELDIMRNKR